MVFAQRHLLPALLALATLVDTSLADALTNASTDLFSAISQLNATLGGRVYAAVPFEKPCFSIYEGRYSPPNNASCTVVQDEYTDPTWRVQHFGAYMLVSVAHSFI